MPSSSFRSTSAQRTRTRNADTPGAGAYNPNPSAVEPGVANGAASMRGQHKRFEKQKSETEPEIGPGAYEKDVLNSGPKATVGGRVAQKVGEGGSSVFASDSVRELPY